MAKLGPTGTRFQETLKRANALPTEPPPNPESGRLHNEGQRWWKFRAASPLHGKDTWLPIEPTDEQREEYRLQVAVAQAEDMDKIAEALKKGMHGEFQKGINLLENPPEPSSGDGGWYETGKGWSSGGGSSRVVNHPVRLQVLPSMRDRRYYIVAECLPKFAGGETLVVEGYLDEEELEKRAESVQVYGQWMRTVGNQLARYVFYARTEDHRELALDAYQQLAERGIVASRHDWMDNPDLTNDVARAIASIKKD